MKRRVAYFAWPLVPLVLFLGMFRRSERGAAAQAADLDCERPDEITPAQTTEHRALNRDRLLEFAGQSIDRPRP